MKVIIVGSVAAGTAYGAKLRRESEAHEITIYERGSFISYSTCGMPYMLGSEDIHLDDLTPRNPEWFKDRFNINIHVKHLVKRIDPQSKTISVEDLTNHNTFDEPYDKLVLATGSKAFIPPITGVSLSHVFSIKTMENTLALDNFIKTCSPKKALVIGTGFIGLEVGDNLIKRGIDVTFLEAQKTLLPALDQDMSFWLQSYFDQKKISYYQGATISEITPHKVFIANQGALKADLIIMATGVRPEVSLAKSCGIHLGESGAILVNDRLESSIKDILAIGDCAQSWSIQDKEPLYRPLGSTANKMGRIAASKALHFKGILGTGILKFLDLEIGFTGMSEEQAHKKGLDVIVFHSIKDNQSPYLKESHQIIIKTVALKETGEILGAQLLGERGVDKRLDVLATSISFKAKAADLFHLDLGYAPPFSTTKDPIHYIGMVIDNALFQGKPLITAQELLKRELDFKNNLQIIDVRALKQFEKAHIPGAVSMPLATIRSQIASLDPNKVTITYCNKGVSGNAAQNILINLGFKEVYNLSGGFFQFSIIKENSENS